MVLRIWRMVRRMVQSILRIYVPALRRMVRRIRPASGVWSRTRTRRTFLEPHVVHPKTRDAERRTSIYRRRKDNRKKGCRLEQQHRTWHSRRKFGFTRQHDSIEIVRKHFDNKAGHFIVDRQTDHIQKACGIVS